MINGAGGSKVKRGIAWLDRNLRKVMRSVPCLEAQRVRERSDLGWEREPSGLACFGPYVAKLVMWPPAGRCPGFCPLSIRNAT